MKALSGETKMKFKWRFIVTALLISLSVMSAHAMPITGGISLAGAYTVDTGDVNTADAFLSFTTVVVGGSGDYSGIPLLTVVDQTPFSFDPFPGSVVPLWTFDYLGLTYDFDLTSLSSVEQTGDNTLTLQGSGTLGITGFDDTIGSWVFTANQDDQQATFSFSSSNAAVLPEPGTLILFGAGLIGLAGFGSKKEKSCLQV